VPGQGHAPLLRDAATLDRIAAFVCHCDRMHRASPAPSSVVDADLPEPQSRPT